MTTPVGYGSVLSESLRIAWRLKSLWILGVLTGTAGGYSTHVGKNFEGSEAGDWGLFIALLALSIGFVLAIAFLILRAIAEGGLITAGASATEDRHVTLGSSWRDGMDRFIGVFAIYLTSAVVVVAAVMLAIVFPIAVGIAVHPVLGVLIALFVGPIFLGAFLFWVPLASFALRLSALERSGFKECWAKAFTFIRRAPGRAIGLSLTRLGFLIAANVVEFALIVSLAGPIVVMWHLWPPIAIASAVLVALPILLVFAGYLGSAGSYFWTLGYMWTKETAFGRPAESPGTAPPPVTDTPA